MNLGLSVFLEVFIHIVLLAYVSGRNIGLQEIPRALEALVQLFLATGFVVVLSKGTAKDTATYVIAVFILLTVAGVAGEYLLSK
jgi:uncharacterized membrane protein